VFRVYACEIDHGAFEMDTAVTARLRSPAANCAPLSEASCYSSDAFAYSLSGGFASTVSPMAATVAAARSANAAANDPACRDVPRTLLIVDAACELPKQWLNENGVIVLPHRVVVDGETHLDSRNEKLSLQLFRRFARREASKAHCEALSASETRDYLRVALHHGIEHAVEIASASSRSRIYLNSLAAAQNLMLAQDRARRAKRVLAPFKMWVVDSQTMFAGQAVIVAEAVRQLRAGIAAPKLVQQLDALRPNVHSLIVPSEYPREFARNPGSGWLSYGLDKALRMRSAIHACGEKNEACFKARRFDDVAKQVFDMTVTKVREGLLVPQVCVSYAGELGDVRTNKEYVALETVCQRRGVALQLSTMSAAGGISAGAGALSMAFACRSLAL
jgi:fatty acid-binding protein DegV